MTMAFYKNLYSSEGVSDMELVLDTVPTKITPVMNDQLLAPFERKEVKEALFQMFPTKAPGPDGFPAHFFQFHWDLCGEEVTSVVLRVLREEDDVLSINDTLIVLIYRRLKVWMSWVDLLACAMSYTKLLQRWRTG